MHRFLFLSILLVACNGDVGDGAEAEADAAIQEEATPDAATPACTPADEVDWFEDADEDGFGDADSSMSSCTQPAGFVANSDDCNDDSATRHPEATELCDGIDNDCDAGTVESCPSQCSPRTDAATGTLYLFCSEAKSWDDAQAVCESQQMLLARVDNQAELDALIATRLDVFGGAPETWIGANDQGAEDSWEWPDGDDFWLGNGNGSVVGGLFNAWRGGQPDNADSNGSINENCAIIEPGGRWDDKQCPQSRRFICERYALPPPPM